MDLITGQRTFYVGFSGTLAEHAEVIEVPFKDSGGNLIKCSYVRTVVGVDGAAAAAGLYAVELSGVRHKGDMVTLELSAGGPGGSTLEGSGICGWGGICAGAARDVYEWHGSNGEVATGIKLSYVQPGPNDAQSFIAGITYGNLFPLNTLRLEQSYDAGS
jgi:hypothetical protein